MPLVTSYATLQTEILDILNRSDAATTAAVPGFIQRAEAMLKRETRAKLLADLTPFSVSSEETPLPSDFDSLYSVAHDGPNIFGPLTLTDLGGLTKYKALHSITTGVPVACAIRVDNAGSVGLMVAPEPDGTYLFQLQHWSKLVDLSDSNTINRWLLAHPDIYVYASLVESAPYLKDEQRMPMWKGELEERLNALDAATQRLAFSGEMTDEPRLVF